MKRFALVAAAALIVSLVGCASEPPPVSDKVAQYYSEKATVAAVPSETPLPAPSYPPLVLPESPRAIFFGDSWTGGYSAAPNQGFSYIASQILGWERVSYAGSGTGYINVMNEGNLTYDKRVDQIPATETADIVILQGGSNDVGARLIDLPAGATTVFQKMKAKFPTAAVIVVGLAPAKLPYSSNVRIVDEMLQRAAWAEGLRYISPIQEKWITEENIGWVIDPKTGHPGTEGHKYYGEKLAADIQAFTKAG